MTKNTIDDIIRILGEMGREPLNEEQVNYLEYILEPLDLKPEYAYDK